MNSLVIRRRQGFTLLETMLALMIGVAVFALILESVVYLYRQGLWLSCHQSAQSEADGLRLFLARDLFYADELKVEDRDGTHLTISGSLSSAYNVQDPVEESSSGLGLYVDTTNRFTVTYTFTPPESGNGAGRLVRKGPTYAEGQPGVPVMVDPDKPVGTILSYMLEAQDGKPVFELLGRGKVRVRLRVKQFLTGMFWGATSDPDNGTRTVDVNLTAIAQRL